MNLQVLRRSLEQVTETFTSYFKPPCQLPLPLSGLWNGLSWGSSPVCPQGGSTICSPPPHRAPRRAQQTLSSAPGCPFSNLSPVSPACFSPTINCNLFASILDGFTHASLFSRDRHLPFPTCHIRRPPQPCLSPPHCSQGSRTGRAVTAALRMAAAAAMTGNQSPTGI